MTRINDLANTVIGAKYGDNIIKIAQVGEFTCALIRDGGRVFPVAFNAANVKFVRPVTCWKFPIEWVDEVTIQPGYDKDILDMWKDRIIRLS